MASMAGAAASAVAGLEGASVQGATGIAGGWAGGGASAGAGAGTTAACTGGVAGRWAGVWAQAPRLASATQNKPWRARLIALILKVPYPG